MDIAAVQALCDRVNELESRGLHHEAIALCQSIMTGDEAPEFHLALSRNHYALASAGSEIHAWPALLAALEGIARRSKTQPDVLYAVDICRWVLRHFADTHVMDVPGLTQRHTLDQASSRADEWRRLLRDGAWVRLANQLLAAAPPVIRTGRSADWVAREARYLLASALCHIDSSCSVEVLEGEGFPLPGDHAGQRYDQYLLSSSLIATARRRPLLTGVPGILITSLPRSASEFLTYSLAEVLQCPVVRVTIGDPLLGPILPAWLKEMLRGGCVTHDHFAATPGNIAALKNACPAHVWAQVRDPRAVFWSLECMQSAHDKTETASRLSRERAVSQVAILSGWIERWIEAAAGLPVHLVKFRELTSDPASVMGEILSRSSAERFIPLLRDVLRSRRDQDRPSSNFGMGDDDAWREEVPSAWHGDMWDAMAESVKETLDLKP
jgi:hypothetical protein